MSAPTDQGKKYNVNPEGAPDGPLIERFNQINTNYNLEGGTEQVPFVLQQPGPFSLKRRDVEYRVTTGDNSV